MSEETGEAPKVELFSEEFQADPFPALAWHREHQPVFQPADVPAFVLTRHADVLGIRDQDMYSTSFIRAIREPIDGINIMQLDGADHKRNRSLVSTGFRPNVINAFVEQEVVPIIEHHLDLLEGELTGGAAVDLNPLFCETVPFWSIARLLGLHIDDQPRLAQLYRDQIAYDPLQSDPEVFARSLAAAEGLTELLTPAIAKARADADRSFLATVINAESKDGDRLTDEEVFGFLRFLLPAGLETTMSSMGTVILNVLSHPEARRLVDAGAGPLGLVIEESLRWHAPIPYINRVTLQDQELHGVAIPAGSLILGSVLSANRDAEMFDAPDEFRPERDPNPHIAFGVGVHMCIGAPLARATIRAAIPRLFGRFPALAVAGGFTPRYHGLFDHRLRDLQVVNE